MPTDRDRERAKRRLAKRGATAVEQQDRRKRNQQVLGAVITMALVIIGVAALSRLVDPVATTTPAASPCPAPTATPAAAKSYPKAPPKTLAEGKVWDATVTTSCGPITLELYGDKAPQTVSSFIFLAREGFYAGSPCHRLTSSAALKVLQCGDPTGAGTGGPGYTYGVENVPKDGAYPAGTLAMARGQDTNSNGSQFFLTHGDSTLPTAGGGYSIFGKVTAGLEVLKTVAAGGVADGTGDGAPARAVSIESVQVTPR